MLSLLHSAVRGHVGFGEVEEECATCGSVGSDLKKCFACKQVRTVYQLHAKPTLEVFGWPNSGARQCVMEKFLLNGQF